MNCSMADLVKNIHVKVYITECFHLRDYFDDVISLVFKRVCLDTECDWSLSSSPQVAEEERQS